MEHKCSGCGMALQVENKEQVGYANKIDAVLCQRCYRLKNFNETPDVTLDDEIFLDILKDVASTKELIVWVVDLFDFNGSYLRKVKEIVKKNPIILVGNKRDLLPKAVNDQKLIDWLDEQIPQDVNLQDIMVLSATKKKNIDQLLDLIEYYGKGRAHVIGVTNTGKSTIINTIVKSIDPTRETGILTSYYAGTTLASIEIDVNKRTKIIDTPGIINNGQLSNYVSKDTLKKILPKTEVRARTYQLNPEQTLFVSGFVELDYVSGPRTSFTVYMSNELNVHRTKMSNASELRENHLGEKLLAPPSKEELAMINKWKTLTFNITEKKTDIVISGMGWFTVNSADEPMEVKITVPEKIAVKTRKSII